MEKEEKNEDKGTAPVRVGTYFALVHNRRHHLPWKISAKGTGKQLNGWHPV
jgi:hypothetical protein